MVKKLIISFFILLLCAQSLCYSQEKKKDIAGDFNIKNLDFTNEEFKSKSSLLADYFQCLAAAKNSEEECNKLTGQWQERCKKHFNETQGFLGAVILNKRIDMKTLNACQSSFKWDKLTCRNYAEALIKKDANGCQQSTDSNKLNQCIAVFTLDPKKAKDQPTIERIFFLKAFGEELSDKGCFNIKDPSLKRECIAAVNSDEKVCEECGGIKKFFESVESNKNKYIIK